MLGYNRWQLFKGLAASFCVVGIVSLLLIYFIPAPPSGHDGDRFQGLFV